MLAELKNVTPKPAYESMPNIDVDNHFASAVSHSSQTGGAGSMGKTAWLSKQFNTEGSVASLGKWNRGTAISWDSDNNVAQAPQSLRAQPGGM